MEICLIEKENVGVRLCRRGNIVAMDIVNISFPYKSSIYVK